MATHESRRWPPARWAVWQIPSNVLVAVLAVDGTAVLLVVLGLVSGGSAGTHLGYVGLIVALGVGHVEMARAVEKVRWRIGGDLHVDLSSVWVFAAAVLFAPGAAAVTGFLVHAYSLARTGRARTPTYRHVFSAATAVLACLAASTVMRQLTVGHAQVVDGAVWDVGVLAAGVLVFFTVNTALVAGAIAVSAPRYSIGEIVGDRDENLLEFATLFLGALTAAAALVSPWLMFFVLPPLLVLHRAVLVRHLEVAASTDGKTGLLNAAAWHTRAERELRKAGRRAGPRAVLVIDLDHFKAVNDTHGHLAGDRVLAAVADALRGEVRDRDLVGRFGGEEFVVLLGGLGESGSGDPDSGPGELQAVAERIRERIARLRVEMPTADGPLTVAGLSASVGCARYPDDGADLRTLLQVADTALYAAKRAGRNVVRMGIQLPATPLPTTSQPTTQPLPTGTGRYTP